MSVELATSRAVPQDLLTDSFKNVQKIFQDMPDPATCEGMATSALLYGCANFGKSNSPGETFTKISDSLLEETKTSFAARYAVCELNRAGATIPPECSAFTNKKHARAQGFRGFIQGGKTSQPISHFMDYETVTERDMKQCLHALSKQPQSWTSYAGARRDAITMCSAMSVEAEKGKPALALAFHYAQLTILTQTSSCISPS